MPYEQPAIVSIVAGINLHGREGVILEFGFREDGVDRPIATADLWFEVQGIIRKQLDPGANNLRRNIVITQDETDQIYAAGTIGACGERYLPFCVRWETISPPQVVWEGLVTVRGYTGEPA